MIIKPSQTAVFIDEYSRLRGLYDQVNADESAKRMFDNFRNVQLQLQQKQMSGEEITQEEVEQAQKTVALVQQKLSNMRFADSSAFTWS